MESAKLRKKLTYYLFPTKRVLIWYFAVLITLAVAVLLTTFSRGGISEYLAGINYLAILGATISVALFTYHVTLKNEDYKNKILIRAEIMFVTTLFFIISVIFYQSESILKGTIVALIGTLVTWIAAFVLLLSITIFSATLIETIILISKEITAKIMSDVKNFI